MLIENISNFERQHPVWYGISTVIIFLIVVAITLFASISASIAFTDYQPWRSLIKALQYTSVAGLAIWGAWKWSPDRRKQTSLIKALYFPLLIMVSLTPIGLHYPEHWYLEHLATKIFLGVVIASMAGLAIWYWRVRHPEGRQPNPESWRGAKYVVNGRFAPTNILIIMLVIAFTIALLPLGFQVKQALASGSPSLFGGKAPAILLLGLIPISWSLTNKMIGSCYPAKPFIWADELGITVRKRFFIPWNEVHRIEIHRTKSRGGVYASGIDIFSSLSVGDDYITVSFNNTDITPSDAFAGLVGVAPSIIAQRSSESQ